MKYIKIEDKVYPFTIWFNFEISDTKIKFYFKPNKVESNEIRDTRIIQLEKEEMNFIKKLEERIPDLKKRIQSITNEKIKKFENNKETYFDIEVFVEELKEELYKLAHEN